jgi:hypothetical protein
VQVAEGVQTLIKVLSKSMDSSLTVDKVELATITRDDAASKVGTGDGLMLGGYKRGFEGGRVVLSAGGGDSK